MIQKYLFFMFVIVISLNASIVTTKHNLSSNGSGDIKASTEKEVCVFCHIPHGAQPGVALWNRAMPTDSYTMYSSTYLERTKYNTVAPTLGTTIDTPGNLSRQCLSCHDGTIAIGDVYVVRGTTLDIAMTGTEGGFMPNAAAGFIGTNLSAHHPVGYKYDSTMTFPVTLSKVIPTGYTDISRDNELLPATAGAGIPSVDKTNVKLYTYSDGEYVECSSCHDPHTNNTKFLREDTSATKHGLNVKTTCISCHEKAGWTGSAHDTAATVTHSTTQSTYGTLIEVGEMGCINCHTPHKGEGQPYLLRKIEQNTCFQGASGTTSTACHGTGGAKDIETPLNPTNFGHGNTLINQDGVHTNLDYIYGEGGAANFPTGSGGIDWYNSVHVECMDCHNQHAAKPGTRVLASSMYPTTPSLDGNKISQSGPLTGASGVTPTWPASSWSQIDTFTPRETAEFEYEVCFKCHSSWGLGNVATPLSDYDTRSDATIKFTDVAWEFNLQNRSGHPVIVEADASRLGSSSPQALTDGEMKTPWKSEGAQTMYCSDCHGTTSEDDGTTAKGPHGSSRKFMLKGTSYSWPTNSSGNHYQVGEASGKRNWSGVFCENCHNLASANFPHITKEEMDGLYCVRCHIAIPHGSPLSRLQAYVTFPEPYNYQGNMVKLNGFVKQAPGSYNRDHASAGTWSPSGTETTGTGNCGDKHDENAAGAESSPY